MGKEIEEKFGWDGWEVLEVLVGEVKRIEEVRRSFGRHGERTSGRTLRASTEKHESTSICRIRERTSDSSAELSASRKTGP
jgi:hypothetical protein